MKIFLQIKIITIRNIKGKINFKFNKCKMSMEKKVCFFVYGCMQLLLIMRPVEAQEINDSSKVGFPDTEKMVISLYDSKPYKYINGAVSHVSGTDVENISGMNRLNLLAGRMAGLLVYNLDGLPGYENSTIRVRGNHTFTSNLSPVILIDGKIDDATMLDPYDIESIVLLKDAASTAMYGLQSANGIILINTRKGEAGRIKVNFNTETSFSQPTRMPKYLDAYNYALLYNEAQLNDDPSATPKYDDAALEAYRTGSDSYKYPNVNWVDEFLKKNYVLTRNNINVSGGGKTARYYVAANYLYNSGVFNVDEDINTYNTNTAIKVMNIHGNVQVNIGENLTVNADIRAKKDMRNAPGAYGTGYANTIITDLFSIPFNAFPIKNEDGSIAGVSDYARNPYGSLNYSGYSIWERSSLSTYASAAYDLSGLIKGLSIEGRAGFNTYTDYYINRTKNYARYTLNADGTYTQIGLDSELVNSGGYSSIYRNFDHYISLKYAGRFDEHYVDALLMYDRQQVKIASSTNLTKHYQGPKGSVSYRYDDRYLADFTFAYQGSEQFPKNRRYGFFPAVAAGWILSGESFMNNVKIIDFLKIRASYGRTANQIVPYFSYLGSWGSTSNTYFFGTSPAGQVGYLQSQVENPSITWEKCLKTNIGLDAGFFNNRLSTSFDWFMENSKDILISNAITAMYGATVYMPEGKFENKGYEIQLEWKDTKGDFGYFFNVNYSVTEDKIVNQNEVYREYPWMYRTGKALSTRFGYQFDRFFTEEDDIASLPSQAVQGGTQRPGDLKYKDLNDDKVIDDNDYCSIGNPKMPRGNYGIGMGVQFKGLDATVSFHGTHGGTSYYSGYTYWAFNNRIGNVLEHHLDRWQPGSGQSADYPRLSLSNSNNTATSSYWVKDNSFVRLKYVELGYTFPLRLSKKAGMTKARIFVNGYNLFCWDKMGIIDPELNDGGLYFPIQRTISVGLNLGF